jgi:hypothetical protein
MMFHIDPNRMKVNKHITIVSDEKIDRTKQGRNSVRYHFARLMTRIDEMKFVEKIIVEKKHDFVPRRLTMVDAVPGNSGCCCCC